MADTPVKDTVRIRIYAERTIQYSRDVNMPRETFEEYERNCENGTRDKWFSEFAESWLLGDEDAYDWRDYEHVEATEITASAADAA